IVDAGDVPFSSHEEVVVTADSPIRLDRTWQLPLIEVAGGWEQGSAQLAISEPLRLTKLGLDGCSQLKPDHATNDVQKQVALQFFEQRPKIELTVSRAETAMKENGATVVSLRANEGTAHYVGEFSTTRGSRYALAADIAPNWILTSVESIPAGLV